MIRPRCVGRRCERAAGLQMCAAAAEERLEEIERKARLAGNGLVAATVWLVVISLMCIERHTAWTAVVMGMWS